MNLDEACAFLSDISSIPASLIRTDKDLNAFCDRYFFHRSQNPFKVSYLNSLIEETKNDTILFIQDALLIKFVIIKTKDDLILFGPYILQDMTEANVQFLMNNLQIYDLDIKGFRAYRNHFQICPDLDILHYIQTLLKHCEMDPYSFKEEHNYDEKASLSSSWEYQQKNFENIVNERYRVEQQMMEQIAEGDDVAAVASYRTIHNNVRHMGNFGSTPDSSRISSGITRATVRMAAVEAGLPPVIIDTISGESSRTIARLNSREEMYRENERMIRSFARAIAQYRKNHYSAMIYSAISYFDHFYKDPISIDDLSSRLGVSISCLIDRFKKETGKTPNAYLCDLRVQKAKRLLRSQQHTIGEVAEMVGIPDANYFVKCFRKITGTTPSAYRKGYYNDMASKKPIGE
ncbi:MAG: helix-turn-helix transcriptional regulator [Erysipelotrichaceae bacterium]|nr:helix-turn-helix transcriptional regulator [Erysipelotrichaceae bacterium]